MMLRFMKSGLLIDFATLHLTQAALFELDTGAEVVRATD
jgi:hypothetical protein